MKNSITALSLFLIFFSCVTNQHANDDSFVEIYKSDGSVQCDPDSGVSLAEMELELVKNGIRAFGRRKDNDGLIRITLCGAETGKINIFRIRQADLLKSKDIGFNKIEGSQMSHKK